MIYLGFPPFVWLQIVCFSFSRRAGFSDFVIFRDNFWVINEAVWFLLPLNQASIEKEVKVFDFD